MRVGLGYDVHKLTEGRDLILGGVKIPYEKDCSDIRMRMCCSMRSWTRFWERQHLEISGSIFRIQMRDTEGFPVWNC